MIETVKIYNFKTNQQDRLKFVRVLAENSDEIGLKKAKELQDNMLRGTPISYKLEKVKLRQFISELENLEIEYMVE